MGRWSHRLVPSELLHQNLVEYRFKGLKTIDEVISQVFNRVFGSNYKLVNFLYQHHTA